MKREWMAAIVAAMMLFQAGSVRAEDPVPLTAKSGFVAKYLVKRKAELSFAEFKKLELEHVRFALALPGLRDYHLSFFPPVDGVDQAFDAMAEVTFDSREAHDEALASPAGQAALADLTNFLPEPVEMVVLTSDPGDALRWSHPGKE